MNTKNKNKNKLLLWGIKLCLLAWLFSLGNNVVASENKLIITEIMYSPVGIDNGREWIEIYNAGTETINIKKGLLGLIDEVEERDEMGKLKNICHTFDSDLVLASGEFAVIVDKKESFLNDYKDYTGKVFDSILSLSNSSDEIKISFDRCKSWEADSFYSSSFGANSNGESIEKIKLTSDNTKDNWQESNTNGKGGTPGMTNSEKSKPKKYSNEIIINEIFPDPAGSDEGREFIEVYNFGNESENLKDWKLEDDKGEGKLLPEMEIKSGEYKIIPENQSGVTLTNTYGKKIVLKNPVGEVVNEMRYDIPIKEDYSFSFDGKIWKWTSEVTEKRKNIFDQENYPHGIYINEIMPNPSEDKDEYIELYNPLDEDFDLSKWILHDSSVSGKYAFPKGTSIGKKSYLLIYKKDFGFALNDSGKESVALDDPLGNNASIVEYSGSKDGVSYNFDGKSWRWSKFLTPGKENKFNNLPEVRLKKDKKIYTNVYTDFDAKTFDADKEKVKIVWDFGDGHKSYKKQTRHKYEKSGKYEASIKVSDGSEDKIEKFEVVIEDFPKRKVKIVALSPNPEGKDSDLEWIEIKNESKKKVNLKDWSIATGWKNLYNHPINLDFIIEPGKTQRLTRAYSAFALNNKKDKIELRYPDGEVADKLKYNKKKESVADDEIYRNIKKKKWGWEKGAKEIKKDIPETSAIVEVSIEEGSAENISETAEDLEIPGNLPEDEINIQHNMDEPKEEKIENIIAMFDPQVKLDVYKTPISEQVLGVETLNVDGIIDQKKFTIEKRKNFWLRLNTFVNKIILNFFISS